MIYGIYSTSSGQTAIMTIGSSPAKSFLTDPNNTDYQAFKADLAKGVELQDANGTAMTADQIATFLATLP